MCPKWRTGIQAFRPGIELIWKHWRLCSAADIQPVSNIWKIQFVVRIKIAFHVYFVQSSIQAVTVELLDVTVQRTKPKLASEKHNKTFNILEELEWAEMSEAIYATNLVYIF